MRWLRELRRVPPQDQGQNSPARDHPHEGDQERQAAHPPDTRSDLAVREDSEGKALCSDRQGAWVRGVPHGGDQERGGGQEGVRGCEGVGGVISRIPGIVDQTFRPNPDKMRPVLASERSSHARQRPHPYLRPAIVA